jgi:VanZ family protein
MPAPALMRVLPAALWAVIILVLLLSPPRGEAPHWLRWPHADKLVHAVLFGVQAWLLGRAWRPSRIAAAPLAVIFLCTVIFAGLTELLQHLLPVDRTGDPADLLADAAGAAIALLVARGR